MSVNLNRHAWRRPVPLLRMCVSVCRSACAIFPGVVCHARISQRILLFIIGFSGHSACAAVHQRASSYGSRSVERCFSLPMGEKGSGKALASTWNGSRRRRGGQPSDGRPKRSAMQFRCGQRFGGRQRPCLPRGAALGRQLCRADGLYAQSRVVRGTPLYFGSRSRVRLPFSASALQRLLCGGRAPTPRGCCCCALTAEGGRSAAWSRWQGDARAYTNGPAFLPCFSRVPRGGRRGGL